MVLKTHLYCASIAKISEFVVRNKTSSFVHRCDITLKWIIIKLKVITSRSLISQQGLDRSKFDLHQRLSNINL